MKPYYVIIDFETTGLDYKYEQVTEVGALKTDSDLNPIATFHTYVKLEKHRMLTNFIKHLTGLTEEFLEANGIPEKEALLKLWDFIYKGNNGLEPIVVAHHAPFDFSFLSKYHLYPREFICTRVLAKLVEPDKSASLKDVAERHGISTEGHHSAMADIEMTRQILAKLMPIADRKSLKYRNHVIDSEERPLLFKPRYATVGKR